MSFLVAAWKSAATMMADYLQFMGYGEWNILPDVELNLRPSLLIHPYKKQFLSMGFWRVVDEVFPARPLPRVPAPRQVRVPAARLVDQTGSRAQSWKSLGPFGSTAPFGSWQSRTGSWAIYADNSNNKIGSQYLYI